MGLDALQVALSEQLARADGQDSPGLLEAVVAGVQVVVKDHPETHDAVIGPKAGLRQKEQPENHRRQHRSAPHQYEPPQLHSSSPGHEGKDHDIDAAGSHVSADSRDEAQREHGEAADLHHRGDGADAVAPVLDCDDQQGQNQDKRDFNDLVGLNHHRKMGDLNPVPVAVAFHSPGGEDHEQQEDAAEEHQLPPFFGEQLKVHKGEQHVGDDPQADGDGLDDYRPVEKLARRILVLGSGENEGQAKGTGSQTQPQQNDVAFFPKFLDRGEEQGQKGHGLTSASDDQPPSQREAKLTSIFYHILVETQTPTVL